MARWSIATKVTVGFVLALGVMAVMDVVSYRSITAFVATVDELAHTHEVLDELDDVLAELKNAETGQRGYLLTGEDEYLEPYYRAIRNLDDEFTRLERLTASDAAQQERVLTLERLIEAKFAELDQTILLFRTEGFAAAVGVVATGRGKLLMDSIRVVVDAMDTEQFRQLREREDRAAARTRQTFYVLAVGSVLGLVLVGVAIAVIRQDIARRERAEHALQQAHDALEERITERTADLRRVNADLAAEIDARRRAQDELAAMVARIERSRDDIQAVLDRLQFGTAIVGVDGRIVFLSAAARPLFEGGPAVLGQRWEDVLPLASEDRERVRAACAAPGGERLRIPVRLEGPHARRYWISIDVHADPREPGRNIFFFYDVTEVYDLRRQLDERAQFQDLIGRSPAMQRVYRLIRDVAPVDATVLIEGETGTGKELVARAIHLSSRRRERPFIAVNAAGLTDSLLASQLFGHKRGAFTGAVADQRGYFEEANGGTLFLDEIGDIPPNVQHSLLRVLQEREIIRVGESRPRRIDVRVIAATHHALALEVERGAFRADLLYRLRVARIALPPLRERREDIPLLVAEFLAQARAAFGKDAREVSDGAMRLLLDHDWPGNVRELKAAIDFAVIRSSSPVLQAQDLPPELVPIGAEVPDGHDIRPDERSRILQEIRLAGGNRSEAARRLGVSRATFYRRLAALGLSDSETVPDETLPSDR
jgi:sigma-54 dependent transcriptional regulator, acetoin dehydrogenase operon transcriptional activator AcoR